MIEDGFQHLDSHEGVEVLIKTWTTINGMEISFKIVDSYLKKYPGIQLALSEIVKKSYISEEEGFIFYGKIFFLESELIQVYNIEGAVKYQLYTKFVAPYLTKRNEFLKKALSFTFRNVTDSEKKSRFFYPSNQKL